MPMPEPHSAAGDRSAGRPLASLLNEAVAQHRSGDSAAAERLCRQILAAAPDDAAATHLLGLLSHQRGDHHEGMRLLRRSIELRPDLPEYHSNLAAALGGAGRHAEAVAALRAAIHLRPDYSEAHNNLGVALESLADLNAAVAAYRRAIELRPSYAEAHNNLGNALHKLDRSNDAITAYRRALALRPDYADAVNNLGAALERLGNVDEAAACYRRAMGLRPGHVAAESNLLVALRYRCQANRGAVFDAHLRWAHAHARPLYATPPRPHANVPDPERPLRLGYVSPDFREHPVTRFVEPLLAAHDRQHFVVTAYSAAARPDGGTGRVRAAVDQWRDIAGLPPARVAEQIRADEIDVLVDLAGHTAGSHQMLLFARRPAPVQVAYLGYSDTTGLPTIGYRITDAYHDPPGTSDAYYTERLVRLPRTAWCYRPFDDSPEVSPLPALSPAAAAGRITFGTFNRVAKITPAVARLWAEVLRRVPASRLLLVAPADGHAHAVHLLASSGMPIERLILAPAAAAPADYLALYSRVDLALDTFPHNGHTTTCDAAWMGVPTVSLSGPVFASRFGLSVLSALGLPEYAVETEVEYVDRAVRAVRDLQALSRLRIELRDRMRASPLMDGAGLARCVESEYRAMWGEWCGAAR